jgi:archaemetzincin
VDKERNPVTANRNTIYLVPSPTISKEMAPMRSWSVPLAFSEMVQPQASASFDHPNIQDIREYIAAAYYGMEVAILGGHFFLESVAAHQR